MLKSKVDKIKEEINRLVRAVVDLEKKGLERHWENGELLNPHRYPVSKHTANVRRASMDVTRALAELRRR